MRVHILFPPEEEDLIFLKSRLDEKVTLTVGEPLPEYGEVQILVAGRPSQQHITQLGPIEVLLIPWTGIPPETRDVMLKHPEINVHNLHHNAEVAAELALSLLLAVAKRILPLDQRLRRGDWRPRYEKSETIFLKGRTALILGYGEIGKLIKKYLLALDVNVKVIRRTTDENTQEKLVYPPEKIPELLPETDLLILALPHTDETDLLISSKEFHLLPRNAILVNVARGRIVDQEALYQALKDRRIFGAGLDVWYNYPKTEKDRISTSPGDYPFHELDNVVMSPHRGGMVQETEKLRMAALARSINAAARGESIPYPVDLDLGY
jgi:phosphoglycerate dehydrogenase-like enzyme